MIYYKHYIGDFLSATDHLSNEEAYGYLRLLWTYYDTEEPLPDNIKWLAKKARVSQEITQEILEEFFQKEGSTWTHGRCHEQVVAYQGKRIQTSEAGKAGAKAKAKAANAKRTSSGRQANGQRISNQESVITIVQDKPERGGKSHPGDLDQVIQYWEEKNLSGDPNAFWDHFESNGWKVSGKTPMKDWKAAARNWSRREKQREESRRAGRPESHHAKVMRQLNERIEKTNL